MRQAIRNGQVAEWHPDDAGWLEVVLDGLDDRLFADAVSASVRLYACFLGVRGLWTGSAENLVRCLDLLNPVEECSHS